jgi:hypothetical protein
VEFARNGDPDGPDLPAWPADTAAGTVLEIGARLAARDGFMSGRLAWHQTRSLALLDKSR